MTPNEAKEEFTRLNAEWKRIEEAHESLRQQYHAKITAAQRMMKGDTAHDQHFQAELEKEQKRWQDIYFGRDPVTLAQEAAREEAQQIRQEQAEQAKAAKLAKQRQFEYIERMTHPTMR
jgi:hypothetical protein